MKNIKHGNFLQKADMIASTYFHYSAGPEIRKLYDLAFTYDLKL